MIDNVNQPQHYKLDGLEIETVDVIKSVTSQYNGFEAFCMGNILKYLIRAKKKNGLEDLYKAQKYLSWLIKKSLQKE